VSTELTCHILGGTGIAVDLVALWLLGHKTSKLARRAGVFGMALVNALFAVQGGLSGNWTLLAVSTISTTLQVRAGLNWKETK
jgi:hypothetical protein